MRTFEVDISMIVRVTLDETKFDKKFADEFNAGIQKLPDHDDPDFLYRHAELIAVREARGVWFEDFAEGYGPAAEMGITVENIHTDVDTCTEIAHALP